MKKYSIGKFLDHRKLQQLIIKMSGIAPKSGEILSGSRDETGDDLNLKRTRWIIDLEFTDLMPDESLH